MSLRIVIFGLSVTSSWGNGHATTYRALVRALSRRGHEVIFFERDRPWYAQNRDLPDPPYAETHIYESVAMLKAQFAGTVASADCVIVGSFVPDGIEIGRWVLRIASGITAFYDIDTPVTLGKLARGECDYLSHEQIPEYGLYLSFTGGPVLRRIEAEYGSPCARALYCSVDPELYCPMETPKRWDLGYLGTYSRDRQGGLDRMLVEVARRERQKLFVVAGAMYPEGVEWPVNVRRIEHLPPGRHKLFYNRQRFTLNLTRAEMIGIGWSPSVRLFEAAACGTPIISDRWPGLESFFEPGREIYLAGNTQDVLRFLATSPESARQVADRARCRVLAQHSSAVRARELEGMIVDAGAHLRRESA